MSKVSIVNNQSDRQCKVLVRTLLERETGKTFDPIQASRWLKDIYGIVVDWHICMDVLEEMLRFEMAIYNTDARRIDGHHNYYILP